MTRKTKQKAIDVTEAPYSPLSCLRDIRPGKFKRIHPSRHRNSGVRFEVYGPARGSGWDDDGDTRQGDEPENGDIHLLVKEVELDTQEARRLPQIEFKQPEIIAIQVNEFLDRNTSLPDLRRQVSEICLANLVRNEQSLDGLEVSYASARALLDYMGREVTDSRYFYQFMAFPLTIQHVEGLISVAEKFYSSKGRRHKLLRRIDEEVDNYVSAFLEEVRTSLDVQNEDDTHILKGGCVTKLDDLYGEYRRRMDTFPIQKFTPAALQ